MAVESKYYSQCDVESWTDVVAISACNDRIIALRADGSTAAVGDNGCGQCDVGGWTDVVAISTGDTLIVCLRADGTVVGVTAELTDIRLPYERVPFR